MNIGGYRAVNVNDYSSNHTLSVVMLHNKHTIKDFQKELNRAKDEQAENISKYGDDWTYISQSISKDFDWFELDYDDDYVTI